MYFILCKNVRSGVMYVLAQCVLCDYDRPLIQLHVPLILILLHYDINQMMLLPYHNHIFN